eukprot:363950-Chlamydomonas_euryale.AAC.7
MSLEGRETSVRACVCHLCVRTRPSHHTPATRTHQSRRGLADFWETKGAVPRNALRQTRSKPNAQQTKRSANSRRGTVERDPTEKGHSPAASSSHTHPLVPASRCRRCLKAAWKHFPHSTTAPPPLPCPQAHEGGLEGIRGDQHAATQAGKAGTQDEPVPRDVVEDVAEGSGEPDQRSKAVMCVSELSGGALLPGV